ncbi:ATP-binding protein [Acidovorax sp. BL-A-41-H1]|uniref:ATP-binding protein n=1 Tax=Acidovorax sp. BL-A-41-H1 TaxID=3421102 RepID=UPI003F7ABB7E
MTSLAQVGTAAPAELPEANGPVCTLVQPSELTLAEMSDVQIRAIVGELLQANKELKVLNSKLSDAKNKLIQSEKLASIGQLAAGVAHEINNPIGFIFSNFGTLEQYLQDLFQMLAAYEEAEASMTDVDAVARIRELREELDIEYLKEDIPTLMRESRDGIQRVRKIVQDLKDFSRVDARQEWESVNLHHGIDSTLNIVNNEIKYKADVVKQYGDLPEVQCLPSELNQVFMNLLVNAAHAITKERGTITIRTGTEGAEAWVEIADDGAGIAEENLQRIFDPFFTTKPVGQGTGLGLSLSYGIVQKHSGRMEVTSEVGKGTTFRVTIPVQRTDTAPTPA